MSAPTFPPSWQRVTLVCAAGDLPLALRCAELWLESRPPDRLEIWQQNSSGGGVVLATRNGCAASAKFFSAETLDSAVCAVVDALASRAGEVPSERVARVWDDEEFNALQRGLRG
jgi:hypothetical protein